LGFADAGVLTGTVRRPGKANTYAVIGRLESKAKK
jgi:hypothetical protein